MKETILSLLSIAGGAFLLYYWIFYNSLCFILIFGISLIFIGMGGFLFRNRRPGNKGNDEMFEEMDEIERGQLEQNM